VTSLPSPVTVGHRGMPSGYRLAVALIIVGGVATSAVLAIVRLGDKPTPYGAYTDAEASRIVGFQVRKPLYLPAGINRQASVATVIPEIKQVEYEYGDPATQAGPVAARGLTVTQATHGNLDGVVKAGHRRNVSVQGHRASVAAVEGSPGELALTWTAGAVDYEVVAAGGKISANELIKVGDSMAVVGK
jgi:hypothetical protein